MTATLAAPQAPRRTTEPITVRPRLAAWGPAITLPAPTETPRPRRAAHAAPAPAPVTRFVRPVPSRGHRIVSTLSSLTVALGVLAVPAVAITVAAHQLGGAHNQIAAQHVPGGHPASAQVQIASAVNPAHLGAH